MGMLVECPQRACQNLVRSRAQGPEVTHKCVGCGRTARTPNIARDREGTLGRASIVKVAFPPPDFPTEWWIPQAQVLRERGNRPPKRPTVCTCRSNTPLHPPPDHLSPQMTRSTSLPMLVPTSRPSSMRIRIPAQSPAISRSRSTSDMRDNTATPTPPPASPHEPSPGPSKRRLVQEANPTPTTEKRQRKKRE